jgi:hypothetical protein
MAKKRAKHSSSASSKSQNRIDRPYPRVALEEAIKVPLAIKEKNGGNPWDPSAVAEALDIGMSNNFYYITAASRDFGLTTGTRESKQISLTDLGKEVAYAPNAETEKNAKSKAFMQVEKFKQVLDYYKGSKLPEMKYLSNTLTKEFGLAPETHAEFSDLFRRNCDYLGIGQGVSLANSEAEKAGGEENSKTPSIRDTVTLAEPETETGLNAFVIMPFRERDSKHAVGFFQEVLQGLIAPAGRKAGFTVTTASRQGSDVIQSTIVNDLLDADLVIADLTEHNPNVLFELGLRMAFDKPVALIRAKGTEAIFDVDNMLRVFDYDPNLWPSTVERDMPKLEQHIKAAWDGRENANSYMKLLRRDPAQQEGV